MAPTWDDGVIGIQVAFQKGVHGSGQQAVLKTRSLAARA
ncbi:hypothetical protein FM111_15580 [Brevundimonas diminuta 3F5N]|uniref:Uncharacterized protein n=1 Tax=Brevundimonas diminuta 3F5N TaxID=1255603 RepID=A0A1R4GRZ1_BREDI|nr:hypothetical protein FM111_15580 [Brevundimonas diminuta 3F5N]